MSGLIEEIRDLEEKVNQSEAPVPHIINEILDNKDIIELETKKDDIERT